MDAMNRGGEMGREDGMGERRAGSRALPPARLAALKEWVRQGGPDDPAVLEVVARRLLARGEV